MDKGNKRPTAQSFKEQGNQAFQQGNFKAAVEHYTSAIKADPSDHVLPCNRALARLKLQQWKLAEADCIRSLELLPQPNCKALFRRGAARKHLGKWADACQDLTAALALEPSNPSIRAELDAVELHLKTPPQKADLAQSDSTSARKDFASENLSSISSSTSDSETDDIQKPLPGSSSATTRESSDASTGLMRELSTTRFVNPASPKLSVDVSLGGTSFTDLKQLRNKKEERLSALRNPYNNSSTPQLLPSPSEVSNERSGGRDTVQKSKTGQFPSASSTNQSICASPVTSFTDFEMKWGMSTHPEVRLSVLDALDYRNVTSLFGEHLEPETLEQIIEVMEFSLKSNEKGRISKAVNLIQSLDRVPRIGILTMFLKSEHQKVIKDLMNKFESQEPRTSPIKLKNFEI